MLQSKKYFTDKLSQIGQKIEKPQNFLPAKVSSSKVTCDQFVKECLKNVAKQHNIAETDYIDNHFKKRQVVELRKDCALSVL